MKLTAAKISWIVFAGAVVLLFAVFYTQVERFDVAFTDKTQDRRTVSLEDSSYTQTTNHFSPMPAPEEPVVGVPGKDQVNQWKAFVV